MVHVPIGAFIIPNGWIHLPGMQGNTLSAVLSSKVNLTMETIFNLHLIFTCIPISLNPSPDYFMHCHASILSVQHTWIKFRDAAGHVATRAAINLDCCVTHTLIIKSITHVSVSGCSRPRPAFGSMYRVQNYHTTDGQSQKATRRCALPQVSVLLRMNDQESISRKTTSCATSLIC